VPTNFLPDFPDALSDHVVVCGLGRFGLRIVQLLREQKIAVVAITSPETREDRRVAALDLGAQLITGDFRFPDTREAGRLESARALILATSDDLINLETALDVRSQHPELCLVMRHSDARLGDRLEHDFDITHVLVPPLLAAPHFAEAALAPPPERLPARARSNTRLTLRPAPRTDLSLLMFLLVLLLLGGMLIFHQNLGISYLDAAYFTVTILTTVGFGDFNLHDAAPAMKLFGMLLMFGGLLLLATLSSLLTNYILSGAAQQARAEQMARRYKDHVIICGLGSVGYAIAGDLRARNLRVVVVDMTPDDAYFRDLATRIPILLGDATRPEALLKAGLGRARALIAATSSDALNLEIGLTAQSLIEETRGERPMPLVLRCFDPDLARRIHRVSKNYMLLSSAELAAPIFVEAALKGKKNP
jgi:voltage-gated potassium channel Kch